MLNFIQSQCLVAVELEPSECSNMLQPLNSLYQDISRDFSSISHLVSNSKSKRSAWFGGIGVVFKHIFGTLDEDDAITYNTAIQSLYNNDKVLKDSIRKSIIVSQSAIAFMNASLDHINTNQEKLNDIMNQLFLTTKNISGVIQVQNFRIKLNAILNILLSNLLTLSFKIEDTLNSILFVKSNTLHPSIMTPHILYTEIVNNLKLVPKYRDFPVRLDLSNVHTILNIVDLLCYYVNGKIVFVIKIPLVSVLEYNLYNNVPLPIPHNVNYASSFSMILSSKNYLAISKDQTSYTTFNDLNSCKKVFYDLYLCEAPDVYTLSGNPMCETEIITKALSSMPENCEYKFLNGNIDIWHKLHNNKWIFVQSKPGKISIECKDKLSEAVIQGTGILDIPFQCIAYHRDSKLVTNVSPRITIPTVTSDFNIVNDSCCNFQKFKQLKLPKYSIKNVNLNNLRNVKSVTDQILNDLNEVQTSNNVYNHVSFPILSLLSILMCIGLIVYFFVRVKFSKRFSTSNNVDSVQLEEITSPRLRTS